MVAIFTALSVIFFVFALTLVFDHFFFVDPADEKKEIRRRRVDNAARQYIACHDCQRPILRRTDLYVAGRFRAGMLPLHRGCARSPGSIAHALLSEGQVNRRGSLLRNLLGFNVLVLGLGMLARAWLPHLELAGPTAIAVVGSAWLVVLRAVAYPTLERRLP